MARGDLSDDERALVGACVNRVVSDEEKLPVALNPESESPAYHLGRLFYVLEQAQYAALGRANATIGDRYCGAASATPARAFGPLLRRLKHHVSDARKARTGRLNRGRIAEVMAKLPDELSRALRLWDQAWISTDQARGLANNFQD